jgi:hypothetical protein
VNDFPCPIIPKAVEVSLSFDPTTTKHKTIRRIFSDRIARNLWIGIKWRHLTSQYFVDDCLRIAARAKRKPPKTPNELASIFTGYGRDPVFCGYYSDTRKLAEELLPYVHGKSNFSYKIATTKPSREETDANVGQQPRG